MSSSEAKSKSKSMKVEDTIFEVKLESLSSPSLKEPVPDSNLEDIAENKSEFATYDEVAKVRRENAVEIKRLMSRQIYLDKEADRFHSKTVKEAKKKNKKNSEKKQTSTGFNALKSIPKAFYEFLMYGLENKKFSDEKMKDLEELDIKSDSKITRSLVTGTVYDYIRKSNLYEDTPNKNKRLMAPDEHVIKLFEMKDDEKLNFHSFQTFVCRLFPKTDGETDEENMEDVENVMNDELEEEVVEEVVKVVVEEEEVVVPIKTKTKSKSKSKEVSTTI
jgi:hypothetical protein